MSQRRASGILAHITSLPGRFGIGDLESACFFLDFLEQAGQSYWQFLPTGVGCGAFGYSPYMSLSAFAGNPLLISPVFLLEKGLLSKQELDARPLFSEYNVDYQAVSNWKGALLRKAYDRFLHQGLSVEDYARFEQEQERWLHDYALFMSLRDIFSCQPWYQWPRDIACRAADAVAEASRQHDTAIGFHKFVQFVFFEQWRRMRQAAERKSIQLIGDIPIYVGHDSVDVWAHRSCFDLDEQSLMPCHVAGVPPDYFSETGQRWGNPLYRWRTGGKENSALYQWWRERFSHIGAMVDVVRIDHFRGFASYWSIPAEEKTAINGKWLPGPGRDFFRRMESSIGSLHIIAEDLGLITPDVEKLRDEMGFPGMKILQFAFDSDQENSYLPHNFNSTNCVVYTGTHDNDTTVGWYFDIGVSPAAKDRARRYANSDGSAIHRDFIRLALSSVAELAVIPLQDVLGFGADCRMNRPSTTVGNWIWRCAPRFLTPDHARWLRSEVLFYGREPNDHGERDESIGI